MAHIHTGPGEHDHTTSGYIIRTDQKVPKVMLHRHRKLGVYLQFGGHIELSENPWQALKHEILEESGYDITQLSLLQPPVRMKKLKNGVLHPYPAMYNTHKFDEHHNHYHSDTAYAFVTNQKPKHPIGKLESAEIVLFSRNEIAKLPSSEIYEDIKDTALFILDVLLQKWEQIPSPN
jgi:8-oxo-dGTP pyrophosphatase MutT (NUDIX family)